ncbi:chloride channel protein [Streptomyces ficellus]|uniref:Chloride channel protein n=2 Tax=Streptomyces ficellus TaxID=1977088 RepID=A0A6I6FGH9_9ACTN|nr:chloride channel protein [Streptomyces ficellus]QGV82434.1 chloride channel protein [Streptomyces ficellus]
MGSSAPTPGPDEPLLRRRYARLLLLATAMGVPIALACFFFVGAQHALQHAVWEDLPEAVGYAEPPWWWPLPALLLAGLLLAPVVTRVPGGGGHLAVHGLAKAPSEPAAVPGVVFAALATLPLGVVLGPEAPLMALGSGLALLAMRRTRREADPRTAMVLGTAGSTAAISTILGGPLVAAVLVVEAAALAGPQLVTLLLPCLLASAAGALVFTGFGHWTGLKIGALTVPKVPPAANPDAGDFLWGIPLAVGVALVVSVLHRLGDVTAVWTARRTAVRTVVCAVAAGVCVAAYALITGRSPAEAALSGEETLGALAGDPGSWPVAALLVLVVCKGLAWGVCLGSLRGGPIFPAVLLGAAMGVACAGLPGLGAAPGLAAGIATATATVTRLPLASSVLAVLLLGRDGADQMPLIVVCSVVGFLTARLVEDRTGPKPVAGGAAPAGAAR